MVDASWCASKWNMNNLSSVCHAEFMTQLIIFFMGRCDSHPSIVYRHLAIVFPILILILAAPVARAQDNYEIQVYGSDLVDPGHTMVELHSNFTIDGSKTSMDGVYPTDHAEHETVEITHGFDDWFECGFYIFTSITARARIGSGWGITFDRVSRSRRNGTGWSG